MQWSILRIITQSGDSFRNYFAFFPQINFLIAHFVSAGCMCCGVSNVEIFGHRCIISEQKFFACEVGHQDRRRAVFTMTGRGSVEEDKYAMVRTAQPN